MSASARPRRSRSRRSPTRSSASAARAAAAGLQHVEPFDDHDVGRADHLLLAGTMS
jgi:hypothetical protein